MATLCAFRSSSKNLSVFKLNMAADKIEIDRQGMHCFSEQKSINGCTITLRSPLLYFSSS